MSTAFHGVFQHPIVVVNIIIITDLPRCLCPVSQQRGVTRGGFIEDDDDEQRRRRTECFLLFANLRGTIVSVVVLFVRHHYCRHDYSRTHSPVEHPVNPYRSDLAGVPGHSTGVPVRFTSGLCWVDRRGGQNLNTPHETAGHNKDEIEHDLLCIFWTGSIVRGHVRG
jgi:hypothetical protein